MSNNPSLSKRLSVYEQQQLLSRGLSLEEFIQKNEMPVEYFTGKVDFAGLTLEINKQVLIPRIETEELIDQALDVLKNQQKKTLKIIDLATGSGAIALALIKQLSLRNFLNKTWEFYLIDIAKPAITLAKKNYQNLFGSYYQQQVKVNFLVSDLFDNVSRDLRADLLLANLPYIQSAKIQNLPASVKNHEPLLALDGGQTGFELIAKALHQIRDKNILVKEARLLFETDCSHDEKFIKKHYPKLLREFEFHFIQDQFTRQRFLQLRKL